MQPVKSIGVRTTENIKPIWDTDNYRSYGLIGPRIVTLQDKFAWLTVDSDTSGNFTPDGKLHLCFRRALLQTSTHRPGVALVKERLLRFG